MPMKIASIFSAGDPSAGIPRGQVTLDLHEWPGDDEERERVRAILIEMGRELFDDGAVSVMFDDEPRAANAKAGTQ
jgi:hypothetical protein